MTLWHRLCPAVLSVCLALLASPGAALTAEERQALDLGRYHITDPAAGYFDREARRTYLATTSDPILLAALDHLAFGQSCTDVLAQPVMSGEVRLPGYYIDNEAWREAVKPFAAFEDTVTGLAASEFVRADGYAGNCLVDVLLRWARADALTRFPTPDDDRQGWYQIESMLFAAGLALMNVRDTLPDRTADIAEIDRWLKRAADIHWSYPGQPNGTCCNNHFYRRALYRTVIGIQTGNDEMFRDGISAIYSALDEATPEGALPLEMKRGERAAHYQNFALMNLMMIAELAERQGYKVHEIEVNGKTLQTLIDFDLAAIETPETVAPFAGAREQWRSYLAQGQYFGWLEPYLARTGDPRAAAILAPLRPVENRSLGGPMTLYFYTPAP